MHKKLLSGLTAMAVLLANTAAVSGSDIRILEETVYAENADASFSGECGAANSILIWKLDSSGTLTITGTGAMLDYSDSDEGTPWSGLEEMIQKIVIENGVTNITNQAFSGCTNLTEVLIPDSLQRIEGNPFVGSTSLQSIVISEKNTAFSVQDGGLLDHANTRLICCLPAFEGAFAIPDGISTVAPYAFAFCRKVTTISIPDSVTTIGDYAFLNCSGMTEIALPEQLAALPAQTFHNCRALKSIRLPLAIKVIPESSFSGCSSLESIVIPEGVTTIGSSAFSGCTALKEIEIPDSVVQIDYCAFSQCKSLTGIHLPKNLTAIRSSLFNLCSGLEEITIPNGVSIIEDRAFYGCKKLAALTLPNAVEKVEEYAADGCDKLQSITVLNPRCDLKMDPSTFPQSAEICGYSGSTAEQYAVSYYRSFTALPDKPAPDKHGECGSEGNNLTWVLDEKGTLTISGSGKMADYTEINPAPWEPEAVRSKIQKIIIQEGVTSVGSMAFRNCDSLSEIWIPESLSAIGDNAFDHCSLLTRIQLSANNRAFSVKKDALMNYKETEMIRYTGTGSSFTLLDSTEKIRAGAFSGCHSLETITAPKSLKAIEKAAFQDCSKLTAFSIPDGVKSVEADAFAGCINLQTVVLPDSVAAIGERAFFDCKSLKTLNLSASSNIQTIGANAFENCEQLEKINLPSGLTALEDGVFASCRALKTIVIPEKVTSIGNSAFYGCASLTGVKIPKNVTIIGESAFFGCSALTEITFPKAVADIRNNAFEDCSSMTLVKILNPQCNLNMHSAIRVFPANVKIAGYENSTAYDYAFRHSLKFETIQYIAEYQPTMKRREILTVKTDDPIANASLSDQGVAATAIDGDRYSVKIEALETGTCDIIITLKTGEQIKVDLTVESEATTAVTTVTTTTIPSTTTTSAATSATETTAAHTLPSSAVSTTQTTTETTVTEITTISTVTTEAVTTVSEFVREKDEWGLRNDSSIIGRKHGQESGYFPQLTEKDKAALLNGLSVIEREKISGIMNQMAMGFCYGLSVMSVLQTQGIFSPSDLVPNANSLFDIQRADAVTNDSLASAIAYYQLLQYTKVVAQQMLTTQSLSEQEKIDMLLSSLEQGKPTLVGYHYEMNGKKSGHAVVAYEIDRNIQKKVFPVKCKDGVKDVVFDTEIKVYNSSADVLGKYNEKDSIFLSENKDCWCILNTNKSNEYQDEVIMSASGYNFGVLCMISSDADLLNYHGLYNGTDNVQADQNDTYYAKLKITPIKDAEPEVITPEGAKGMHDEDLGKIRRSFGEFDSQGDSDTAYDYWYMDAEYGYAIPFSTPQTVNASMEFENCLLSVVSDSSSNVKMEPNGTIELTDEEGAYSFRMVLEQALCSTRWYDLKVSGKDGGNLSLRRVDNGWLLTGDSFDAVEISANDFEQDTKITFSAPQKSVLICEAENGRIGIKADLDDNGSYEAMLTKSGISAPLPGDINGDNAVKLLDAGLLNRYIAEEYTGNIVVQCDPDFNGDGYVDILDIIDMRKQSADNQ